jgi:UDP-N-acetylglucosamine transferase subunit ALG13
MIFVTVGTSSFDSLINCMDQAVADKTIRSDVIMQIGYGGHYTPKYSLYFRGSDTLEPFERAAELVVCHGGTGTIIELLLMKKRFISVVNPTLKDNHQNQLLVELEKMGIVNFCRKLEELPQMVSRMDNIVPSIPETPMLAFDLEKIIREFHRTKHVRTWIFDTLIRKHAIPGEIDKHQIKRKADIRISDYEHILSNPGTNASRP